MRHTTRSFAADFRHLVGKLVNNSWLPAVFPILAFAGYLLGGEVFLAFFALGLPMLWLLLIAGRDRTPHIAGADPVTGFGLASHFENWCAQAISCSEATGKGTACIILEIDDAAVLPERFGTGGCDRIQQQLAKRLRAATRGGDQFAKLSDWQFGIILDPVPHLDIEACIQLAVRLQATLEDPVRLDGVSAYVSASVGLCLLRDSPGQDTMHFVEAAETALITARRNGPSAIRAYSPGMAMIKRSADKEALDVAAALEAGHIKPWFQPQIDTVSKAITGCEALARWEHPDRGLIPPDEFLPLVERNGFLDRLGEDMLYHALSMLQDLDQRGLDLPVIGVNFSLSDLRNPKLPDRVAWELDRFAIAPERLCVEILEQVVAESPDDITVRNIAALSEAGCRIDLDDFGTGHASITSLRRFAVDRLKIDRSFVVHCDQDPDQRRMVSTIISMAQELGLDTLAEGVETIGEQVVLTELGCGHLQGFGIARPMPLAQLPDWITAHETRLHGACSEATPKTRLN
ncbi:bifunctional diguanylate cyclase/phosphodiesterase [Primorskyibacter aestuariivivens]|uniref:putative bifunctional diguanylate cyclase/phosphodiesterase n=1 Tax=Primorskyibacter aestuariivivens TaxID=1888912 RepID=UPI002301668A|nr:bifunctional diguanylate cyclase/phosphodiesterase [Primorskyibacter aestuariivivens]MDA7430420.1 bifunctional diguanylate cyclase/phosphodiesterase [Primorskyibacter aestuariivivens]